jgi:RNA polymerase sigma factor (sigma-70 family)
MVIRTMLSHSKSESSSHLPMQIEEMDRRLDVPVARFTRAVSGLLRELSKGSRGIDVRGYRDRKAVAAKVAEPGADLSGSFYHVSLRRFPAMDRAEEFRMAKRYELLRERAKLELIRAGMRKDEAAEWVTRGRSAVNDHLRQLAPAAKAEQAYLQLCLADLEDLRNLYVEGALQIVLATVHRYRGLGVDTADLIQEGNASLFQAVEGFDWRRDVRFWTYAQYWVQQAVLKVLYNTARTVRIPIWVQKLLGKIRKAQAELRRDGGEPSAAAVGKRLGITAERVEWVLATKRYAVSIDAGTQQDESATLAQTLTDENALSVPELVPEGDLRASLVDAMSDLPERERKIIERRFGLGGSEPETLGDIAVDLGVTAERVRQLQNAALERLKRPAKLRRLRSFVENA